MAQICVIVKGTYLIHSRIFLRGDLMTKESHEILRDLREDHDYTQQFMADYLGIQRTMYRRYETGETEIPLRHLRKLCLFYKISADYIMRLPKGLRWPRY